MNPMNVRVLRKEQRRAFQKQPRHLTLVPQPRHLTVVPLRPGNSTLATLTSEAVEATDLAARLRDREPDAIASATEDGLPAEYAQEVADLAAERAWRRLGELEGGDAA
jgi:hypothetical protein